MNHTPFHLQKGAFQAVYSLSICTVEQIHREVSVLYPCCGHAAHLKAELQAER